jgi:hypothetical protein
MDFGEDHGVGEGGLEPHPFGHRNLNVLVVAGDGSSFP